MDTDQWDTLQLVPAKMHLEMACLSYPVNFAIAFEVADLPVVKPLA